MAINPNFDVIGKEFVKAYYAFFDTPGKRESVAELYHNEALLSFEDDQREGKAAILDKLTNLPFKAVQHATTKIDSQPMMGGWIMVSVIGQLKVDEDGPMGYTHTFVLRPEANSYFIMHEVFRLVDEDGPMGYTHTFVLRPEANSYFIMHEVFRLILHNF